MGQKRDCPRGQQQSQHAASEGQQEAFCEQLCDDAPAARAHGGSQRDLFAPRGTARQQKVGHIHARHQQQASHGRHQHPKRPPHAAYQFLAQNEYRRAPALIQRRQRLFHLCAHRIQFRPHLFERAAAARNHHQVAVVGGARIARIQRQGNEDIDAGLQYRKSRRQHPNHCVGLIAQANRLAHDARIAGEAPLPQRVAQQHKIGVPRLVFLGPERAAQPGLHAEQREKAGGDPLALELLRVNVSVGSAGEVDPLIQYCCHQSTVRLCFCHARKLAGATYIR